MWVCGISRRCSGSPAAQPSLRPCILRTLYSRSWKHRESVTANSLSRRRCLPPSSELEPAVCPHPRFSGALTRAPLLDGSPNSPAAPTAARPTPSQAGGGAGGLCRMLRPVHPATVNAPLPALPIYERGDSLRRLANTWKTRAEIRLRLLRSESPEMVWGPIVSPFVCWYPKIG